jgi:hypothetical protein
MSLKRKSAFREEMFAGKAVVKTLKVISFALFFVMFIFSVAAFATARTGFGYRGFLAYAGIGLISGVIIFELAEVIRLLEKLYRRFDLYDKIDQ